MQTMETIEHIVNIMRHENKINYALMHCISSYPTEAENSKIGIISFLKKKFSNNVIGYSGHELGIEISKAAVLLGARIIERHFTLDKQQKGSDHKCSLEPLEMAQLICDVKDLVTQKYSKKNYGEELTKKQILSILPKTDNLFKALNSFDPDGEKRKILSCEMDCRLKLGKSIVASRNLIAGEIIKLDDLCVKVSEPNGISAEYVDSVIGLKLSNNIKSDCPLLWSHVIQMESKK